MTHKIIAATKESKRVVDLDLEAALTWRKDAAEAAPVASLRICSASAITFKTTAQKETASCLKPSTFVVNPHQKRRCSDWQLARILLFTAGSREGLEGVDNVGA